MNINASLFGQMITFGLLIWITMKFIWPPLIEAMEERQKTIADGLAAAEKGLEAETIAREQADGLVKQARDSAGDIVSQSQRRANEIVEGAKEAARQEADRLLVAARAEIEQEKSRARDELRAEVVVLALRGAEKILAKELSAESHNGMLVELAAEL